VFALVAQLQEQAVHPLVLGEVETLDLHDQTLVGRVEVGVLHLGGRLVEEVVPLLLGVVREHLVGVEQVG